MSQFAPGTMLMMAEDVKSNAIQSSVENFKKASGDVDTPDHPADGAVDWRWRLRPRDCWFGAEVAASGDWVEEATVTVSTLGYAITPGTFEDVVEYVVPECYPTEYAPGTLRNKLFGRGDKLPENHRAAGFRLQNARPR